MLADTTGEGKEETNQNDIHVSNMLTNMFATIGSNDLVSLKQYLESDECNITEYAKAIEYNYGVWPRIYNSDTDNLRQLNPDTSFTSLGLGSTTSSNSIMSSMMSTDVFFQMPSDTKLFENQYDVKAGKWPSNYNECVLVLTSKGNISDYILYTLGLRDYEELDKMIEQFLKEEDVETPDNTDFYSYEEILNTTFKLISTSDCYEYDSEYKIWRDKSDNTKYMKNVVKNGEDLKIVGIVQPKEGITASMLQPGICYPSSLTNHIIEKASNSKIVKEQLKSPKKNVFTGKKFDEDEQKSSFDMKSLIEIDEKAMKSAFKVDQSKLNVDFGDLSKSVNTASLPTLNLNSILSQVKFSVSPAETQSLMKDLLKGYQEYAKENGLLDVTQFEKYFSDYLQSKKAQEIINTHLTIVIKSQNIDKQISKIIENYMETAMASMTKSIEKEITASMNKLSKSMSSAINIDEKAFASSIRIKMGEEELTELITSLMSKEKSTYEGNLKKLDYANLEEPDGIDIYPKDFEANEAIKKILDEYNEHMEAEKQENKVISYTDMVGTLMNSVTIIVDVVSYVLIAFVAISLVVSSIMIGVITYISVLERKKEIGILRAIGASKHNVAQVFNAETFMIGLFAGVIGIGITLLLLIPINKVIHMIAEGVNVNASLPVLAGIILIILSTVLTLIGGIIPSKKAAKEDPVLALRSE